LEQGDASWTKAARGQVAGPGQRVIEHCRDVQAGAAAVLHQLLDLPQRTHRHDCGGFVDVAGRQLPVIS
jgi:hypothetical protein